MFRRFMAPLHNTFSFTRIFSNVSTVFYLFSLFIQFALCTEAMAFYSYLFEDLMLMEYIQSLYFQTLYLTYPDIRIQLDYKFAITGISILKEFM